MADENDVVLDHRNCYDAWLKHDGGRTLIGSIVECCGGNAVLYWHIEPWGNHDKSWNDRVYATLPEARLAIREAWKQRESQPVSALTKQQEQQREVTQVVSTLTGGEIKEELPEMLTVRDFLHLARRFLWVANEGYCNHTRKLHASSSVEYMECIPIQASIHGCVIALDRIKGNTTIPDEPPRDVGLPPGDDLQKLARLILAQHGQRLVSIGSSAFSV